MEKIAELLKKITIKIPAKTEKKLKALDKLNEKLALAKQEHEELPTADSEEQLRNITEYVNDETEEVVEELEGVLEIQLEAERQPEPVVVPVVETPAPVKPVEEVKPVVEEEKPKDKEKEGGMGWLALVGGLALLVVSAGVINTLNNK